MNEATPTVPLARTQINFTPAQEARFWAKINKDGPTMPHMESPCWVWTACKNKAGYGSVKVVDKTQLAHRVAWMLNHAEITNILVCHRCDNPACCRIDHLFLGTAADNARDRAAKGRNNSASGDKHGSRTKRERRPRGEANHFAKLTATTVIEIRSLYAAGGITLTALAVRFGVGVSTIHAIVRRKIWQHIP